MNPIYEPVIYSKRELEAMKARLLLKGINSWNHTNYSLICMLLKMPTQGEGSGDNNCIKPTCDKPDSIKQKSDCLEQMDNSLGEQKSEQATKG